MEKRACHEIVFIFIPEIERECGEVAYGFKYLSVSRVGYMLWIKVYSTRQIGSQSHKEEDVTDYRSWINMFLVIIIFSIMQSSGKSIKLPWLNAIGYVVCISAFVHVCECRWTCGCGCTYVHVWNQRTSLGVILQSLSRSLPLLTHCLSLAQDLTNMKARLTGQRTLEIWMILLPNLPLSRF